MASIDSQKSDSADGPKEFSALFTVCAPKERTEESWEAAAAEATAAGGHKTYIRDLLVTPSGQADPSGQPRPPGTPSDLSILLRHMGYSSTLASVIPLMLVMIDDGDYLEVGYQPMLLKHNKAAWKHVRSRCDMGVFHYTTLATASLMASDTTHNWFGHDVPELEDNTVPREHFRNGVGKMTWKMLKSASLRSRWEGLGENSEPHRSQQFPGLYTTECGDAVLRHATVEHDRVGDTPYFSFAYRLCVSKSDCFARHHSVYKTSQSRNNQVVVNPDGTNLIESIILNHEGDTDESRALRQKIRDASLMSHPLFKREHPQRSQHEHTRFRSHVHQALQILQWLSYRVPFNPPMPADGEPPRSRDNLAPVPSFFDFIDQQRADLRALFTHGVKADLPSIDDRVDVEVTRSGDLVTETVDQKIDMTLAEIIASDLRQQNEYRRERVRLSIREFTDSDQKVPQELEEFDP